MDYTYKHPLYTDNDKELAMNALIEYLENNNVAEHSAISNEPFVYQIPIVPRDTTRQIIELQYGVNIISIANILNMQDLFFSKYMPHLSKYLYFAGIDHYFSYIRPSQLTATYIMYLFTHNKKDKPLKYWNPNIFWSNYAYSKTDTDSNLTNPLNNFYSASLVLIQIDNYDFIREVDAMYGIKDRNLERGVKYNVNINFLPALNPSYMIKITKLIHKYF